MYLYSICEETRNHDLIGGECRHGKRSPTNSKTVLVNFVKSPTSRSTILELGSSCLLFGRESGPPLELNIDP